MSYYQVLDERKGGHNRERACCMDCRHLKGLSVSWWCTSPEANAEGKRIPYYNNCSHWEPCETLTEMRKRIAREAEAAYHALPWVFKLFASPTPLTNLVMPFDAIVVTRPEDEK